MAATDQQIADNARDALNRILQTDTSAWSEGERRQQQLEISSLEKVITTFDAKAARTAGRRIFQPMKRVPV